MILCARSFLAGRSHLKTQFKRVFYQLYRNFLLKSWISELLEYIDFAPLF